jgi:hypothetical protein
MYLAEVEASARSERADAAPERRPATAGSPSPSAACRTTAKRLLRDAREWVVAMDFAQLNGADLSSGPRWLRAKLQVGPVVLADALVRGREAQGDRLRRPCGAVARGVHRPRPHRLSGAAGADLQRGRDRAVARQLAGRRTCPATGSTASTSTMR